jgi:hypothetical protein
MGRERDPEIEFFRSFRCGFSRIFGGKIATFGVENPVEIWLKSISRLLTKRSKMGAFERVERAVKISPRRRSLTVMQSFRSMNVLCAGVAQW